MTDRTLALLAALTAACVSFGEASAPDAAPAGPTVAEARRIEREAFEQFANLALLLPPVVRTENLADYSTNKLDFALNNGLAMTRGGRIWAN